MSDTNKNTIKIIGYFLGGLIVAVALVIIIFPNSSLGRLYRGDIGIASEDANEPPPPFSIGGSTTGSATSDTSGTAASTGNTPPYLEFTLPAEPACTDNDTKSSDTMICQDAEFVLCDTTKEGTLTKDKSKECRAGKWQIPLPAEPDEPAEPVEPIEISDAKAVPAKFDPIKDTTKIQFSLNKKAIVTIEIFDENDKKVLTITDDQEAEEGDWEELWYGTEDNKERGFIVEPGDYTFKITAKNPETEKVEDTAEGPIEVDYKELINAPDPEDKTVSGSTTPKTTTPPVTTTTPVSNVADNQNNAIMAMNNATSGRTVDNGPGIAIYAIFPLVGYFLARRAGAKRSASHKRAQ